MTGPDHKQPFKTIFIIKNFLEYLRNPIFLQVNIPQRPDRQNSMVLQPTSANMAVSIEGTIFCSLNILIMLFLGLYEVDILFED